MILFPIASGGDLAGLIFFAIFALIAWLTNKARNAGEAEDQTPRPPGGGRPTTDDALEEWLKGLVEEQKPPPPQHQPPPLRPPPVIRPAPAPRQQRPAPALREAPHRAPPPMRAEPPRRAALLKRPPPVTNRRPTPVAAPVAAEEPVIATRLAPSGPDIQGEIRDLAARVADEVHTTSDELIGAPAAATPAAAIAGEGAATIARRLRSPGGLREGVILMEILGKPRAFSALRF